MFPIWEQQLKDGKPLTVTDLSMVRYMAPIDKACGLIVHAAENGKPGDILILDMGNAQTLNEILRDFLDNELEDGLSYPVEIIGLRPGESMEESLWSPYEHPVKHGDYYLLEAPNVP